MKFKLFLLFTFLGLTPFNSLFSASIIFDITGFIIKENVGSVLWDIGPTKVIGLYNPLKITEDYFSALNQIAPHRSDSYKLINDNLVLPQVINDWLSNNKSSQEIKDFVVNELKKLEPLLGKKANLFKSIAEHMFTPSRYTKAMDHMTDGIKILKKCCQQKDASGKRKHKVFLLSNQNSETYKEFFKIKKIKAALELFDDYVISGDAHMLKPDPAFYEYAFKKFGINPDNEVTIYIDYEATNITAARNLGKKQLQCIYCKDYDFKPVVTELRRFGIFS